jgi:hypothetical protein
MNPPPVPVPGERREKPEENLVSVIQTLGSLIVAQ